MSAHRQGCCCDLPAACGCCHLEERCGWVDCLPADVRASVSAAYSAPEVGMQANDCCYMDPIAGVDCFAEDDPATTNGCAYFISAFESEEGPEVEEPCGHPATFSRADAVAATAAADLTPKTVNHPSPGSNIWLFGTTPLTGQIIQLDVSCSSIFAHTGEISDQITTSLLLWVAIDTGGYAGYVQASRDGADEIEIIGPSLTLYHRFPCGGLIVVELEFTLRAYSDSGGPCVPGGYIDAPIYLIAACHFETSECPVA